MNKLMNWMEQVLVPLANRFSQNPILKTMSQGAMSLLAVIMVGSIFSILNSIPWEPYTAFLQSSGLQTIFNFIPAVTTELLGLYMAYSVGRAGAQNFGLPDSSFTCGILSLVCYLILVPFDSAEGITSMSHCLGACLVPGSYAGSSKRRSRSRCLPAFRQWSEKALPL